MIVSALRLNLTPEQDAVRSGYNGVFVTPDGAKLRDTPNAGGNSVRSEILSLEFLHRVWGAKLLATETQVNYYPPNSAITDYVCKFPDDTVIGVSVTRAFHYKGSSQFTSNDANRILKKKLIGAIKSTKAVLYPEFKKQILHIFCQSRSVLKLLISEYRKLRSDVKGNTVVLMTLYVDQWLYNERAPKLPKKIKQKPKQNTTTPADLKPKQRKTRKRRNLPPIKLLVNGSDLSKILEVVIYIVFIGVYYRVYTWFVTSANILSPAPQLEGRLYISESR